MASILVIGSTGMLGSAVTKFIASSNHKVIESNTSGTSLISSNSCIKFDISKKDLIKMKELDLNKELELHFRKYF